MKCVYIMFVLFLLVSVVSTSPLPAQVNEAVEERPEDKEECWCGLFRAFMYEEIFVMERTVGERCDDNGDIDCTVRCIEMSRTMHLQYTLLEKLCKVYNTTNKIMMGIASKTCEDRYWVDVGLRNEISCFNGSYTDSTVPMDKMEEFHVQTDVPEN